MTINISKYCKKILDFLGIKSLIKPIYLKIVPYTHYRMSKEVWDSQYSSKYWDGLKQIGQLSRYSVIVGYCNYFQEGGTILDLGCGEGILQEKLCYNNYLYYVGVDYSAEAISKALNREDEKPRFVNADISDYSPGRRFDFIIFNESLYYIEDPLRIVKRYMSLLEEGGLLIVSMLVTEKSNRLWKMIEQSYDIKDEVLVTNKLTDNSWVIKVLTNLDHND